MERASSTASLDAVQESCWDPLGDDRRPSLFGENGLSLGDSRRRSDAMVDTEATGRRKSSLVGERDDFDRDFEAGLEAVYDHLGETPEPLLTETLARHLQSAINSDDGGSRDADLRALCDKARAFLDLTRGASSPAANGGAI